MGIPVVDRFDGDMSEYTRRLCVDDSDVSSFWETVAGEARMRPDNIVLTKASVAYRESSYPIPKAKLKLEAKPTPIGIAFNVQDGQNCYLWCIEREIGGNYLRLYKVVTGVVSLVKELVILLPATPTFMYMKIDRSSPPAFSVKLWEAGQPEPGTPTDTASDSQFSSGKIGLFAGWMDWDKLSIVDNLDWATQEFPEPSGEFYEDFETGDWLGLFPGTTQEFYEDFESGDWLGLWPGYSNEFVEDFELWGGGPI